MSTAVPVVEAEAIACEFPGPPPVTALADATFRVDAGEMVAIVGASGSGKSTLLNVLGLLQQPTAGAYRLAGTDLTALDEQARNAWRAARIGIVFQSFHLLEHRTARENVEIGMLYLGTDREERRRLAVDALVRVGLAHRVDARPTVLSGGERQRVAIARALAKRPALLLADEPTGNLDSTTSRAVMDLFRDLNAEGLTILMVTHDPAVAAVCGRKLEMCDGVLAEVT